MVNSRCGKCGRWQDIDRMKKYIGKYGDAFMCNICQSSLSESEQKHLKDSMQANKQLMKELAKL